MDREQEEGNGRKPLNERISNIVLGSQQQNAQYVRRLESENRRLKHEASYLFHRVKMA